MPLIGQESSVPLIGQESSVPLIGQEPSVPWIHCESTDIDCVSVHYTPLCRPAASTSLKPLCRPASRAPMLAALIKKMTKPFSLKRCISLGTLWWWAAAQR